MGHVAPAVLALFAGVFVLVALRDRSATMQVPVASVQILPGMAVNAGDTRLVKRASR